MRRTSSALPWCPLNDPTLEQVNLLRREDLVDLQRRINVFRIRAHDALNLFTVAAVPRHDYFKSSLDQIEA